MKVEKRLSLTPWDRCCFRILDSTGTVVSEVYTTDDTAALMSLAPEMWELLELLLGVDNPDNAVTAQWTAEDWKAAKRQANEAIEALRAQMLTRMKST